MSEVLTIKEVAPMLNVSESYLRDLMRFNLIDIGSATKLPGKSKYHYMIFKSKLDLYMKGERKDVWVYWWLCRWW